MPELASVPTRQARRSASPGPGPSTLRAQARRYGQAGFGSGSGLRMERTRKDDREMEMRGRRGAGESNLEVRQDPGQPQQSPSSESLGSETGASPTSPGVDSSIAISSTTRPLFFSGTSTSMPVPTPTTQSFTGTGTGISPVVSTSLSGTDVQATTTPTSTDTDTLAPSPSSSDYNFNSSSSYILTSSDLWTPTATAALPGSPTLAVYVPVAGQPLEQGQNGLIANLTLAGDDVDQS